MSETTRLGISITATDTNASASIKALQSTISALEDQIGRITRKASQWGGEMSATAQRNITALQGEISAIQAEISARNGQAAAIRSVTAALTEQGEAAAVVHRSLQQGINASLGINADRSIISATASSRVLATSLSAAAEADGRLRDAAIATAAALRLQQREQLLANIEASKAAREGTVSSVTFGRQLRGEGGRQQIDAALGTKTANEQAEASTTRLAQRETIYQNLLESRLTRLGQITPLQRLADASFTQVPTAGFSKYVDELLGVSSASKIAAGDLIGTASAAGVASSRIGASATSSTRGIQHLVAGFDELSRGQRGALFSTIGAAARDAGLGTRALTASVGGLVAVLGTAAIFRHAETLGKWAADTRAAAAASAMSIESYSQLRGALELTGQKGDEADATLRRLAVNLGTAIANPASLAAQAFHNLGVNQDQLVASGGDLSKILPILAGNFTQQANDANKATNYNEIAGRGYQNLFKILQNGKTHFQELQDEARKMGLTLTDETAKSLEETGQKVDALSLAISGDLTKAFIALGPIIQDVTKTINAFATGLAFIGRSIADMRQNMGIIARGGAPVEGGGQTALGGLIGPGAATLMDKAMGFMTPKTTVPPLVKGGGITSQEQAEHNVAAAGLKAAQGGGDSRSIHMAETSAEIAEIKKRVDAATAGSKEKLQAETELYRKEIELANEKASAGTAAAKQAIRDQIAAIKEGARDAEDAQKNIRLDATLGSIAKGTFAFQGQAKAQGPAADIARSGQYVQEAEQIRTTAQKEIEALKEVEAAAAQGSTVQKAAAQEILNVTTSAKAQEVALYEKAGAAAVAAANKINAPIQHFFDGVGNQFEALSANIISALVAPQQELLKVGLTTRRVNEQGNEIRTAFKNAIVGIAGDFAKTVETAIGNTIAHALSNVISGVAGNTLGELLSSGLSKLVGSIFGSTAGTALGNVAGSAAGGVVGGTGNAAIAGGVTSATGALTAFTTALTSATGVLSGHTGVVAAATGVTGANATATTANVGATVASTGATATHAAVTGVGVAAIVTHAAVTATDTAVKIPNIAQTVAHTLALIPDTVQLIAHAAAVAADAVISTVKSIFAFESGGVVPSAAGGMIGGTGATLAVLHAREMVLPAPISQGLQSMIARGGNTSIGGNTANLSYSPTINAGRGRGGTGMTRGEFAQMMALHGGSMLGEARNMVRAGFRG